MSDFENAKAQVVRYLKEGKLSKENAQQSLAIYKALLQKGKKVDITVLLQKKGFLESSGKAPEKVKGGNKKPAKTKKPSKPVKPTKKLLQVDESDNKYTARRRKANKKPALIGGVILLITLSVAYFLFQKAETEKFDHAEKQRLKREEMKKKSR